MATVNELMTTINEIAADLDRVETLVRELRTTQGVPEAALDPILDALSDVKTKATGIV